MKTLTGILFAAIFFAGCKEDEQPDCEKFEYGTYCFENKYGEYVTVEIDGAASLYLAPFSSGCVDGLSEGFHSFFAHETTYSLPAAPRSWSGTLDVVKCLSKNSRLI